jgi:hypothetical protein
VCTMTSKGKTPAIVGTGTFGGTQMELHVVVSHIVEEQSLSDGLFRLYFAQHFSRNAYYAGLAASGPIVTITVAQWKDWKTPFHDENLIIIEKVEDVETNLITARVKFPCTTLLDKKTYETSTKNLIQDEHTLLITALYNTCDKQDCFKTFTTTPSRVTFQCLLVLKPLVSTVGSD